MITFTFNDPHMDALDPEDRRFLAHVWRTACIALDAADETTREAVARQVASGAEMVGDVLSDGTIVVRVGELEVLRTTATTFARQVFARENPEMN